MLERFFLFAQFLILRETEWTLRIKRATLRETSSILRQRPQTLRQTQSARNLAQTGAALLQGVTTIVVTMIIWFILV